MVELSKLGTKEVKLNAFVFSDVLSSAELVYVCCGIPVSDGKSKEYLFSVHGVSESDHLRSASFAGPPMAMYSTADGVEVCIPDGVVSFRPTLERRGIFKCDSPQWACRDRNILVAGSQKGLLWGFDSAGEPLFHAKMPSGILMAATGDATFYASHKAVYRISADDATRGLDGWSEKVFVSEHPLKTAVSTRESMVVADTNGVVTQIWPGGEVSSRVTEEESMFMISLPGNRLAVVTGKELIVVELL